MEDYVSLRKTKQEIKKEGNSEVLRIIPLGGIGEIGKNMTAIEWGESMIVIDCGLCFPGEELLGVDYVIPDTTYLEANRKKLKAFFITHGHEDHIGALPYVCRQFPTVPVFASRLTIALIEEKFEEFGINGVNLSAVKAGGIINIGPFKVEFIKVCHSIDDAMGFAIHTPEGVLVHTGDFKVDFTPVDGKIIDLNKFADLGKKGVLALMSDSTNAEREGYTVSEKTVGNSFEQYFPEAKGRIIIATFASNIHRLQQVVDAAKVCGRKIAFSGRSMVRMANVATELGYLKMPDKMFVELEDVNKLKDDKICILTTGSQGEPMSGLVRMASGDHSQITIKPGDMVIISSTPIPGNEKYVSEVINMLYRRGANVIYGKSASVHVSGHACREELKLMIALTKPKYVIPVHGEYRHLYSHAGLAESMGYKAKNVFMPELGRPIEFKGRKAAFGEPVHSGSVLIDGLGIGDVGNVVLRDRKQLSSDGMVLIIINMGKANGAIIGDVEIISRGFIYVKESEELIFGVKKLVTDTIATESSKNRAERLALKGKVKKEVSNYLYNKTKRRPMIIPIIMEV